MSYGNGVPPEIFLWERRSYAFPCCTSLSLTNYCRSYDVIRDAGGVHLKGSPKLQDMPFDKAPKTPEGIFRGIEGAGKILETAAFYKKIAVCNPRVRAL